jgi:SAM-dependent methyltransferase
MASLELDIRALELFLKQNQHGPEALEALRLRTASHWIDPSMDRLSSRMLPAYDKLCELVKRPFHILDVGCMNGYLWHHMKKKLGNTFRYVGIDIWDEALTVAEDFQPGIEVSKCNALTDELPQMEGGWDYVWCSNIQFDNPDELVERLVPIGKTILIAQPPWCGDYVTPASKYGAEVFDCGETQLVKINGAFHIQRT